MKTRKFFGIIPCQSVTDLSSAQQANLISFKTREEQIAEFKEHDCDWTEADIAPHAAIEITVKVQDVLQHNPNEGVWVYGASAPDIARVKSILGDRVCTSNNRRVEGWR